MQTNILKTIYSSEYIRGFIISNYNLRNISSINLLKSGINDVYKIVTLENTYILKIFSILKKMNELQFEIEYIFYLKNNNILVSYPINSINNNYIIQIPYPEGIRFAFLTNYSNGYDFTYNSKSSAEAYDYGYGVARLHKVSQNFMPNTVVKNTDIKSILIKSSNNVENFLLKCESNKIDFFNKFSENLLKKLNLKDLEQGYCHGDLHGGNAKFHNRQVNFFDFEFCSYGYNLYDLATFKWGCLVGKRKNDWKNFIEGYKEILPFSDIDLKYLLHFVALRHIFIMSLDIGRVHVLGNDIIGYGYIDKRIKLLKYIDTKINKGE